MRHLLTVLAATRWTNHLVLRGSATMEAWVGQAAQSAIWTYERADGRRLVIPFSTPGLPAGTVQIDIVFGEHLPIAPQSLTVLGVPVTAATPGLSLAWKLQWLATDTYPQGKDLYDAVLLAEHTTVALALDRT